MEILYFNMMELHQENSPHIWLNSKLVLNIKYTMKNINPY